MVDPDLLYLSHPFFFIHPWEHPQWLLPSGRRRSLGRPGRHRGWHRGQRSRLQPVARPGSQPPGTGSSPGASRNRCSNRISVSPVMRISSSRSDGGSSALERRKSGNLPWTWWDRCWWPWPACLTPLGYRFCCTE